MSWREQRDLHLSRNTPAESEVERVAPVEALLAEAYQRGWREGCETMIEDYPDALIAVPHRDAMGEGCGTFIGEVYTKLTAVLASLSPKPVDGDVAELVEFLREEAAHYDRTIYKQTRDKFDRAADMLHNRLPRDR